MPKDKAETSSHLKLKSNGTIKSSSKLPSSSRNEEVKKSREPSTDRNHVKKSLTSQKTVKKVESPHLKINETTKVKSSSNGTTKMSTSKKTITKDKINVGNVTPRTSISKSTTNPVKSLSTNMNNTNSSRSSTNVPSKGTKLSSRDITSKRVTKEQYFPKKYPFSSYLHENEDQIKKTTKIKSVEQKPLVKSLKKVSDSKAPSVKLTREHTLTRTLSSNEDQIRKNINEKSIASSPDISTSSIRPGTATIRKHHDIDIENQIDNISINLNSDDVNSDISKDKTDNVQNLENSEEIDDYEDDFDSYESDFEVYSSSSTPTNSEIETNSSSTESEDSLSNEEKFTEFTQKRTNSAGTEEERKLDSGNYDLPDIKHKQILDKIKEAVEKENSNLSKESTEIVSNLASLSDEGFEDGSKHSLVNTGFINFMDARKKQQQKKINLKSRKRGDDLMSMIRLNNVSFSLFDMTAISYDEFMQSYGKSGTIQVSSQTGEDDIDEEVQTEYIESVNKSTQFPIRFSKEDEHLNIENEIKFDTDKAINKKLNKFMERTGKLVLNILEQRQKKSEQITKKNERELPFSEGYFSLNFDNVPFMKNRTVIHMAYSKNDKLLTVHQSNIQIYMNQNTQLLSRSAICIWDISVPIYPQHILVSSGEITKACFDSNFGFLIFAGICDGSISLWDLRENSNLHRSIYDETTDTTHILRSPTYTTVTNVDGDHNSAKIISVQSYYDNLNEKDNSPNIQRNISGIQAATLDEAGLIVLWSVIQKQATPELLSEDQGLIPWGCVLLVQGLTINLQKLNPKLKELQCFDLQFSEADFSHLYIATNYGVLHCLTSGMKPKPKYYSIGKSQVNCVEMAPFSSTHFLSGCENGHIKLHSRFYEKPLMTLCSTEEENKLEEKIEVIEWSNNRPCVFFIKDKGNFIHIWDLTASDMYPIYSIPFLEDISDIKFLSSMNNSSQYMAIASKKYGVQIHSVSKEFSQISPEKYKTELNIFLNYANRL